MAITVIGGLSVATVSTLLIVPLMLSLVIDLRIAWARLFGREFREAVVQVGPGAGK